MPKGLKRILIIGIALPIYMGCQSTNIGEGLIIWIGGYIAAALAFSWIYSGFTKH